MKICFIITGLGMGGAERQVCDLADELTLLKHNIIIISLGGNSIVKPKSKKIELIELNMKKTPLGLISSLKASSKIIKDFKPNIIHSHMVHANIFARLVKFFIKIPKLICSAHGNNEGGILRILSYRITDRLADLTTNVSKDAVNVFIKNKAVIKERIINVPNGIDHHRFQFSSLARTKKRSLLNINEQTILYLAIGRLCEPKDYSNMLCAFASVVKESKQWDKKVLLAIIGQGELEKELKTLASELKIQNYVHFLGMHLDVEDWLSAADFYVMSSAWEGLPLVIAEAMSVKRFVIATDCGGVKELVGNTGVLVPPKDYHALANAMLDAMRMPSAEKTEMTTKARARIIKYYSLSSVVKKWLNLYQS